MELPKFERASVQGKEVVFYLVHVCSGHRKWKLNKRFNDFYDLDKEMRKKHGQMPPLPPKTYFPLKYDHDIEERRQRLHLYLQELMNRVDMRTNPAFRKFIELDEQIPESVMYQPIKIASINDLPQGGRDYELVPERGLIFIAMAEMNIANRIDSYITNVSEPLPFDAFV